MRANIDNKPKTHSTRIIVCSMLCFMLPAGVMAARVETSQNEILDRLQRLESQQQELEKQLQDKDSRIDELEEKLSAKQSAADTTHSSQMNAYTPGKGTTMVSSYRPLPC